VLAESRVLVITEVSKKSGLGNLKRSSTICHELLRFVDFNLLVISNEMNMRNIVVSETLPMQVLESIDCFPISDLNYSHVLIDVGTLNLENFIHLVKKHHPDTKVVALDYFFDSGALDLRISVFDQESRMFTSSDKKHLVGLEYAVIDELPEIRAHENTRPTITTRFSGENPNFLGKVRNLLETLNSSNSIKVQFLNNSDDAKQERQILPRLDYLEMISNSNLVICSGVTTLFECSILKVPTIFVGSNALETTFGFELSRNNKIVSIDGFSSDFELELKSLLSKVDLNATNYSFVPNLQLDFNGKHRVIDAILSL
jgi:spore coat polysaccharide biosynthesis predicted glycosyltransferase SpsG